MDELRRQKGKPSSLGGGRGRIAVTAARSTAIEREVTAYVVWRSGRPQQQSTILTGWCYGSASMAGVVHFVSQGRVLQ